MIDEQSTPDAASKLGAMLREARLEKGWTLRQAATDAGLSNGYLSLIEHGEVRAPSPRYLLSLASSYGLPFPTLMHMAGHPSAAEILTRESGGSAPRGHGFFRSAQLHEVGGGSKTSSSAKPTPATSPRISLVDSPTPEAASVEFAARSSRRRARSVARDATTSREPISGMEPLNEQLARLLPEEIAQVRAFIAGVLAGRR